MKILSNFFTKGVAEDLQNNSGEVTQFDQINNEIDAITAKKQEFARNQKAE